MQVIIRCHPNQSGLLLSYIAAAMASLCPYSTREAQMANRHGPQGLENSGRLLAERQLADNDPRLPGSKRPARTVQVNLAESPLGWLAARGRISRRQFDAGEQLRRDWTKIGRAHV